MTTTFTKTALPQVATVQRNTEQNMFLTPTIAKARIFSQRKRIVIMHNILGHILHRDID